MKLAIAAIVKDEIDSLLEWIAYHRVVGADRFLIADNGSQDGTREMLEALSRDAEDDEWLQVIDVPTPADRAPQLLAYEKLAALCPEDVELIAFIDADEYILPVAPKGQESADPRARLHAWMEKRFADDTVGAISLNWCCFGSSGQRFRQEGLVIERFQRRAKQGFGPNHHYKSIVRRSALARMQNPHHPELTRGEMRNAQGERFEFRLSREGMPRRGLSEEIVWSEVRLNHYLVKSVEEFVLKKARRGSAATVGYTKTAVYFERHDRNDDTCTLAAALAPRVRDALAELEVIIELHRRLRGDATASLVPMSHNWRAPREPKEPLAAREPSAQRAPSAREVTPAGEVAAARQDPSTGSGLSADMTPSMASSHAVGAQATAPQGPKESKTSAGKKEWSLFSRKPSEPASPVRHWVIDYPKAEGPARVEAGQVLVQGWLFLTDTFADFNAAARLVARWAPDHELKQAFTKKRPDVVAHFGFDDAPSHPQLQCGFQFLLPLGVTRCELELEIGRQRWPLQTLKVRGDTTAVREADKVLVGKNDWLFLRADTNLSAEQHRGNLLLTRRGIASWRAYFDALAQAASARGIQHRVLITPSKETVLEEAYGTPRAATTPVDQILTLAPGSTLYPLDALKALGDDAFYRTDTHWTHRAAKEAATELAVSFGVRRKAVNKRFAQDSYRTVNHLGDLGGKLEPPVRRPVEILGSFSNAKHKVYDNAVPNFGRLVIFDNPKPLSDATLLLCGASSSAGLFNYLSRIFARLIFVHTAGNLDPSLVEAFSPDYLVMQTTARFAIRAPTTDFSFDTTLREKLASLDVDAWRKIDKNRVASDMHPLWERWETLYQRERGKGPLSQARPEGDSP